jgi:glycosyltransferase involved in cell wall biosynthesis
MIVTNLCILRLALKQKGNIYHFHDPELIPVGIILKLSGKKVIYDVHEDLPEQILSKYYIPSWQSRPLAAFFKLVEQLASKVFNYIITATDNIQEKFNKHEKVVAIRNFPILDLFKHTNANHRDLSSHFKLIYTGGLFEIRGITQIVQALEYVNNNVELILLGEFAPKEYVNKVRRLKGFGKVRYLGKVPFEEVSEYYSSADIGIVCFLPERNHIKAMPNKLFEYMAAGLPVIASDFPLWKKIIDDAGCGICVDPTNPKEIAGAILHLFNNPQLRKQMGENGRRAVEEKYNWKRESERLLRAYEKLS